jgi:hypothetical protein
VQAVDAPRTAVEIVYVAIMRIGSIGQFQLIQKMNGVCERNCVPLLRMIPFRVSKARLVVCR